jgi:hypothetical protein
MSSRRLNMAQTWTAICVGAAALGAASPCDAIDLSCDPTNLWDVLPRGNPTNPWDVWPDGTPIPPGEQGTNGIRLQRRSGPSPSLIEDQTWLSGAAYGNNYWGWGYPDGAYFIPWIVAWPTYGDIFAHPGYNHEGIIRITLDGPGGLVRVKGSTAVHPGGSLIWDAVIYKCAGCLSNPLWSGGPNENFDLVIPYESGSELWFGTWPVNSASGDWAIWRMVTLAAVPTADTNGDGAINGMDLGLLLAGWNGGDPCLDLNGDGVTDSADLGVLLAEWTG